VVEKAGYKNNTLQIIFNFVSKYYFIKDIQLALHNKLKMHGELKILATLDLVPIRLNIRWDP